MYLNELLRQKNISRYRLSRDSGVPQTTITDICSGKTRIEKCSGDTLYKIAKTLDVTMESLIRETMENPGSLKESNLNSIISTIKKRKQES